jgi:hypothetical protein
MTGIGAHGAGTGFKIKACLAPASKQGAEVDPREL